MKLVLKQLRYATVTVATSTITREVVSFDTDTAYMEALYEGDDTVLLRQHYMLVRGRRVTIDELEQSLTAKLTGIEYKPGAPV